LSRIKLPSGWHVVKLEQRSEAVLVPPNEARERIREDLHAMCGKEAIDIAVEQLCVSRKVELLTLL
jgi:parvulin-like peptidyl-prolyl isomerase